MSMDRIVAFAKEQGYDSASSIGKWKGYDIYEPLFKGDQVSFVGLPLMIMARGDIIRMSTGE